MARGVRKSPLEKLKIELEEVQSSIEQYENCLKTLRLNEKDLLEKLELEELKEFKEILQSKNMSMDDLKELVTSYQKEETLRGA